MDDLTPTDLDLIRRREALHALGVRADDLADADVGLWSAGEVLPNLPGWRDDDLGRWVDVVRAAPVVARAIVDWTDTHYLWTTSLHRLDAMCDSRQIAITMEYRASGQHDRSFASIEPARLSSSSGEATVTTRHVLQSMAERMAYSMDLLPPVGERAVFMPHGTSPPTDWPGEGRWVDITGVVPGDEGGRHYLRVG